MNDQIANYNITPDSFSFLFPAIGFSNSFSLLTFTFPFFTTVFSALFTNGSPFLASLVLSHPIVIITSLCRVFFFFLSVMVKGISMTSLPTKMISVCICVCGLTCVECCRGWRLSLVLMRSERVPGSGRRRN